MTYDELINKVRAGEHIPSDKITCENFFKLVRDREIRTIRRNHTLYELNFIQIDSYLPQVLIVRSNQKWNQCLSMLNDILNAWIADNRICISLENKIYEIIVEVLETE